MNYFEEYDKTNPLSIENYAQKLIGKTFQDVIDADEQKQSMQVRETLSYGVAEVSEIKRNKGNLGQIIEERFFHTVRKRPSGAMCQWAEFLKMSSTPAPWFTTALKVKM